MSILISYIGNYTNTPVNDLQLKATALLLDHFVDTQQIFQNFSLYSLTALATNSSDDASLFQATQKLPNYNPGLLENIFLNFNCNCSFTVVPCYYRRNWEATVSVKYMKKFSDRGKVIISPIPEHKECNTFVSLKISIKAQINLLNV
jgi:hypothetical protein